MGAEKRERARTRPALTHDCSSRLQEEHLSSAAPVNPCVTTFSKTGGIDSSCCDATQAIDSQRLSLLTRLSHITTSDLTPSAPAETVTSTTHRPHQPLACCLISWLLIASSEPPHLSDKVGLKPSGARPSQTDLVEIEGAWVEVRSLI